MVRHIASPVHLCPDVYCVTFIIRAIKAASSNGSAHRESGSFMSRCVVCDFYDKSY